MLRWDEKWGKNRKRPYFKGHERPDVIEERKNFIKFFLELIKKVYQQTKGENVLWMEPSDDQPYIIVCHDKSNFRSGEDQSSRWQFKITAPLYKKGSGKSLMFSYFLVQHKYVYLFELDYD